MIEHGNLSTNPNLHAEQIEHHKHVDRYTHVGQPILHKEWCKGDLAVGIRSSEGCELKNTPEPDGKDDALLVCVCVCVWTLHALCEDP